MPTTNIIIKRKKLVRSRLLDVSDERLRDDDLSDVLCRLFLELLRRQFICIGCHGHHVERGTLGGRQHLRHRQGERLLGRR